MKVIKNLLVLLLVIFLGGATYFLTTNFLFNKRLHAADVIPAAAIFVFETNDPVNAWNQLVSQPLWGRLRDIPSLKNLENQLLALDSLAGRSGKLENFLKGQEFTVSLHQSSKSELDFLFSIGFSGKSHEEFIQSLTGQIDERNIRTRSYSGVRVLEYQHPGETSALSYALVDNLLLGSYSSFLLEDAIRHSQSSELPGFKSASSVLYDNQSNPTGLGVLRLNSAGIARFIQGMSNGEAPKELAYFAANKLAANLEMKFSENKLLFEGTSFFADGEKVDIKGNGNNKQHPFSNYVSNRTAVFHRYNVIDPFQIQTLPNLAFEPKNTLEGEMGDLFPEDVFFRRLTGEIGYMVFEESGTAIKERILLIKTAEVDKQTDLLKEFNWHLLGKDPEQLEQDAYLGKRVFGISAEEFPAHVFDGQFTGFPQTYVTSYDQMIVLGNSMKAVRNFLDDMYTDNTWGKSIYHKQFLEYASPESGYDFLINVPRIWTEIINMAAPEWKVFFQKYAPQLKSVDWLVLQQKGSSTYIESQYRLDAIKPVTDIVLAENMAVQFNDRLIYGPQALQNFNDRSREYLVQDERHQVHLVSEDGSMVFSQQVVGEITGDVFQIDFYKNGKLQLLFATDEALYGMDRLGALLPGYPIHLPSGEDIRFLNLVDYDKDLDYRYFVGTELGSLFLFDKNGKALEGWAPKYTSGALATTPSHHRIARVGDFMVALNRSGDLYLTNRKGELKSANPLKLGEEIATDYAIIESARATDTQLVTINQEGEVVKVNFNGEITYRNQLLRPDQETRFRLVRDQAQSNHLFVLHEYNKISVLDADEEPLFEKSIFSDDVAFQYFSFGGDKNIFVVIDKVQEFIYLYDLHGQLLNTRPISGYEEIEISYSGSNNEYSILVVHGNRLSEYKMPL